ncbi:hypothetical protein HN903_03030 [archaeon]|jgi:hypothetical protein|nr:hypothetical protein [archaeon]MBT7128704.1 hypothetical protein [archaeon]
MNKIINLFLGMILMLGVSGLVVAVDDVAPVAMDNYVPPVADYVEPAVGDVAPVAMDDVAPVADYVVPGEIGDIGEARKIGFFENNADRLQSLFTFNKEKKVKQVLGRAEKMLSEAEILVNEDSEAYMKMQKKYEKLIAEVMTIIEGIKPGKIDNGSSNGLKKIAEIQSEFNNHKDRVEQIYARARKNLQSSGADIEKTGNLEISYETFLSLSNEVNEKIQAGKNSVFESGTLDDVATGNVAMYNPAIDGNSDSVSDWEIRISQLESRISQLESQVINLMGANIQTDVPVVEPVMDDYVAPVVEPVIPMIEPVAPAMAEPAPVDDYVAPAMAEPAPVDDYVAAMAYP